jgi:hypothetical protein
MLDRIADVIESSPKLGKLVLAFVLLWLLIVLGGGVPW